MQKVQFDSFGERMLIGEAQASAAPQAGSRWMLGAAVGFWLLVAAVVAARVIFAVPAS